MSDISRELWDQSFKNDKKLKKICEPLSLSFGVDTFWHHQITSDGRGYFISNRPDIGEYFTSNKLYIDHPYYRAPTFFKSGYYLPDHIQDSGYQNQQGQLVMRFSMDQIFLILIADGKSVSCYGFATTRNIPDLPNTYVNNINLFRKFARYFNMEAVDIIRHSQLNTVDFAGACGETFYRPSVIDEDPLTKNSILTPDEKAALRAFNTLSKGEKDAARLWVSGRTMRGAADELKLSPRTIESYIENVRNKIGLTRRKELFDIFHDYDIFL